MRTMTNEEKVLLNFFRNVAKRFDVIQAGRSGFRAGATESKYYKANLEALEERFKQGWTVEMINARIKSGVLEGRQDAFISELIPLTVPVTTREDSELLKDGVIYKHPALRNLTPAIFNEDNELVRPMSVTRVESFTLGSLANYYTAKLKPNPPLPRTDLIRGLRSTLNKGYTVDVVLSAIDLWAMSDDENMGVKIQDLAWVWVRKVKQ